VVDGMSLKKRFLCDVEQKQNRINELDDDAADGARAYVCF